MLGSVLAPFRAMRAPANLAPQAKKRDHAPLGGPRSPQVEGEARDILAPLECSACAISGTYKCLGVYIGLSAALAMQWRSAVQKWWARVQLQAAAGIAMAIDVFIRVISAMLALSYLARLFRIRPQRPAI